MTTNPLHWVRLELTGGPADGWTCDIDRQCLRPDVTIRMRVSGRVYSGNGPYQGVETHEDLICEDHLKEDEEGKELFLT